MRHTILATGTALAAAAVLFAAGAARADDRDFKLINATGYPINHVYIDEAASSNWTDDILGRDVLEDGDWVDVKFGKGDKGCRWDMKVTYTDGESAVWSGFDLCQISTIKLRWNKNTGVTSAETN